MVFGCGASRSRASRDGVASYQLRNGGVFKNLVHELTSRSIKLDPDPNRPDAMRLMKALGPARS